jgi:hypothetical protein
VDRNKGSSTQARYQASAIGSSTETVVATFGGEPALVSTDDAQTWKPIVNARANDAVTVLAMTDGKFLLGGMTGTLRVLDASSRQIITQITAGRRPIPAFARNRTGEVFGVDIDGWLYALDPLDLRAREVGRIPVRSQNNWLDLDCCDDRSRMYAAIRAGGIFRSTTHGKDWNPVVFDGLSRDAKFYKIEPVRNSQPAFATSAGIPAAIVEKPSVLFGHLLFFVACIHDRPADRAADRLALD